MKFQESATAHYYLDGLNGIEIGGSAHNAFGLNTLNVDKFGSTDPRSAHYRSEQIRITSMDGGTPEVMPVDVVAPGDRLPFPNKKFDFVISSHVLEHFYDPIGALKEWMRVASKYMFCIVPKRDALPSDVGRDVTSIAELIERHNSKEILPDTDEHHTVFDTGLIRDIADYLGVEMHIWETDDKAGNGHAFLIDLNAPLK
jgi:SAM-dependent methyltransferase